MAYPRFPVAVHALFFHESRVLLLRRHKTGYEDGNLGVVAGHVEPGETVTAAAIREAREEVGVHLDPRRLEVVGVMHRLSQEPRVDFFLAYSIDGEEPENCEPEKCSELLWARRSALPDDTIPYIRTAIENLEVHRAAVHGLAAGDYPSDLLDEWSPPVMDERVARTEATRETSRETLLLAVASAEVVGFGGFDVDTGEVTAV